MLNLFNFFPVGHGLFYLGSLNDGEYNFVYDCGTESSVDMKMLIHSMRWYIHTDELDFVVLSHLHKDHFSGLKELLSVFKTKKLFLPYLGTSLTARDTILAMTILYSSNGRSDTDSILNDLSIAKWLYSRENIAYFINDNYTDGKIHLSKREETVNWVFDFYARNFPRAKINQLTIDIDNYLISNSFKNIDEVIRKGKINDIKSIYESIFGKGNSLNKTSICLLHYPKEGNRSIRTRCVPGLKPWYFLGDGVTFLTGDAMIDKKMLKSMKIEKTIDVLQVPHHGSKPNWKNVSTLKYRQAVVPCSKYRKHGLPNKYVFSSIPNRKYNEVTESINYPYLII